MKLKRQRVLEVLGIFLTWRFILFLVALLALHSLPSSRTLFPYKDTILEPSGLPSWVWSFGNFDGVHYLRAALLGYKGSELSQAFFPLYPMFIWALKGVFNLVVSGLIVSNIFFLLSLFVLLKLYEIDNDKKTALYSLLLLVAFPTAYYFGSIYSESVFLFFTAGAFYLQKKKVFIFAGLFAMAASATRLAGVFIAASFCYELWRVIYNKRINTTEVVKRSLGLLIAPMGLLIYMIYLKINFGSLFLFVTSPLSFGTGRTGVLVLLPQVLYRYIKILLSVPVLSMGFFNASFELLTAILIFTLLILGFKKIDRSYWIFVFLSSLVPTLTGTLTSMPRYILAGFLLMPFLLKKTGKYAPLLIELLFLGEVILTGLFVTGYWVA